MSRDSTRVTPLLPEEGCVQPGTWVTLYSGHMGNTFWSMAVLDQGLHGDRTESLGVAIRYAQGHRSKVDTPMPFIDGVEPDGLSSEHLNEVDERAAPLRCSPVFLGDSSL